MPLSELIHQKPSEKIEVMMRRHPITFLPKILLFIILLAVPALFPLFFGTGLSNSYWGPVLYLLGSAYILLVLVLFLAQFVDYYLDIWIVTNKRVIDIQQTGLFKRSVTEFPLTRVQDATSFVTGVFGTFFNYGNVEIQTAGAETRAAFLMISKPHKVRNKILALAKK